MNNKTYTFHIHGMHCKACVFMTESELKDLPNIVSAKSNLNNHSVEIVGDFGNKTPEQIAVDLTVPLQPHGYTVSVEKQLTHNDWSDFKIAVPTALVFVGVFIFLQKIGLVNLVNTSTGISYGTAFVVGIVASLSSCMAVVGGLLLSMSATFAKEGEKIKPQLMFHGGRVVSFFIFGGIIGAIGTVFTLNTFATFILSLIIGLVMVVLGLKDKENHMKKEEKKKFTCFLCNRDSYFEQKNRANEDNDEFSSSIYQALSPSR